MPIAATTAPHHGDVSETNARFAREAAYARQQRERDASGEQHDGGRTDAHFETRALQRRSRTAARRPAATAEDSAPACRRSAKTRSASAAPTRAQGARRAREKDPGTRMRGRAAASGHGSSITGSHTRYHQIGCACVPVLTPWMRSNVWLRKIACAYSSPPCRAAGIAHASAITAPSTTRCDQRAEIARVAAADAAVPPRREHGGEADVEQHHRPFREDAEPDAETRQKRCRAAGPRRDRRCRAARAARRSSSSTSNMIALANVGEIQHAEQEHGRRARRGRRTREPQREPREQDEAQQRAHQRHRARGPRVHAGHEPSPR